MSTQNLKKFFSLIICSLLLQSCAGAQVKKALITGITGQDGSYLADFLLQKGYQVYGLARHASTTNTERVQHCFNEDRFKLYTVDLTDNNRVFSLIKDIRPDEIYNLAAQSHVGVSFLMPEYTANVDALGTLSLLEAIRLAGLEKSTKFYQASTSELYGKVQEIPQSELTPFYPRSPYGVAKLYAYWITKNYREAYNIFACNGILFNHESPRRGKDFVTRKITLAVARIKNTDEGHRLPLRLGNLDAKRDWGHAKDYVEGMWLMLQQDKPDDYVLATGEAHSVREFVEYAFKEVDITLKWQGADIEEKGIDSATGEILVEIDPQFFRPSEVDLLMGNPAKAFKDLKWQPKITFRELVHEMVEADCQSVINQKILFNKKINKM